MKLDRRVEALEVREGPDQKRHFIHSGSGYLDEPKEVWAARDAEALAAYGPARIGPDDLVTYVHGIGVRGAPECTVVRS